MGKLTLMIVAAAILGGATLKLGMNAIAGDTAQGRAEGQADVLARQIAETGQSLVLSTMVGEEGFVDPGVTGCPDPGTEGCSYDGGRFTVRSVRSADNREVTVTVEGRYGGAVHTVQNTYAFDPMEYPGPIWLDVPYATANVSSAARISGTAADHPVRMDSRPFDELQLASAGVSRQTMESTLAGQLSPARGVLNVPTTNQWQDGAGRAGPLVEDLSQGNDLVDGEGLYQASKAAMGTGDVTLTSATTVTGSQTWGGPSSITRVVGSLTVNGTLNGSGVLLVEGPLTVASAAAMRWNGIVIVRADQMLLPVKLLGNADIEGGLVIVQNAFPPGGHLDVTVMRNADGMGAAPGLRPSPNWPLQSPVDFPWWEHTHRFDLEPVGAPRGGHVEFARNGQGAQEAETQFWTTLRALGDQPVFLEFRNPQAHGFSEYTLELASEPEVVQGNVRSGFGPLAQPGRAHRTRAFAANDLRTFMLDVQSQRALARRFDGEGSCDGGSWPFCIGREWNRTGALSVRLVRENGGATLYDAALYWHMKDEERQQHEAEEAAWRYGLSAGTTFGTRLEMGPQASIEYHLRDIVRLASKVGFDGNEVRLLSSTSQHVSASELRAATAAAAGAATQAVCHQNGGSSSTTRVNPSQLPAHVGHGDYPGPCQATPPTEVTICHVANGNTGPVRLSTLPTHLGHGDTIGACPARTGNSGPGNTNDDEDDD
ncbi:MAG TPA: hypothetical protein VF594_11815 [Rubricoccaceae bacterium]|jgi:hypothetical protein